MGTNSDELIVIESDKSFLVIISKLNPTELDLIPLLNVVPEV